MVAMAKGVVDLEAMVVAVAKPWEWEPWQLYHPVLYAFILDPRPHLQEWMQCRFRDIIYNLSIASPHHPPFNVIIGRNLSTLHAAAMLSVMAWAHWDH